MKAFAEILDAEEKWENKLSQALSRANTMEKKALIEGENTYRILKEKAQAEAKQLFLMQEASVQKEAEKLALEWDKKTHCYILSPEEITEIATRCREEVNKILHDLS